MEMPIVKGSIAAMAASAREKGDIIIVIFRYAREVVGGEVEGATCGRNKKKEVATIATLRDCPFLQALFTCDHERVTRQKRSRRVTDLPSRSQVKLKNKGEMEYRHKESAKDLSKKAMATVGVSQCCSCI